MRDAILRRREIAQYIAAEPWACSVYRRGARQGDPELVFTFTGRIASRQRRQFAGKSVQPGEQDSGIGRWIVVAPFDTAPVLPGDEIHASYDVVTHKLDVLSTSDFSYKKEVVAEEIL